MQSPHCRAQGLVTAGVLDPKRGNSFITCKGLETARMQGRIKQPMHQRNLKRDHERFVCNRLLETLRMVPDEVRMGNDRGEPDVIYQIGNHSLGIELATAYYEDCDARDEWMLARGEREFAPEGIEQRAGGGIGNPDDLICDRIQHELVDKCAKRYEGAEEIWLCIEQRAPLADARSVRECVERLMIPESGFARIYIFYEAPLNDGGGYQAVQIYEHA
jgi:hypothetical protein